MISTRSNKRDRTIGTKEEREEQEHNTFFFFPPAVSVYISFVNSSNSTLRVQQQLQSNF